MCLRGTGVYMKHSQKVSFLVEIAATAVLLGVIATFIVAALSPRLKGDAYIGDFSYMEMNEDWTVIGDGAYSGETPKEAVSLPYSIKQHKGHIISYSRNLPADIDDGMRLMTRSSMQDITIYIDGKERGFFGSSGYEHMQEQLLSAYIMVDLSSDDAGKKITIEVLPKTDSICKLQPVNYADGNNSWFEIIKNNLPIFVTAFLDVVFGVLTMVGSVIVMRKTKGNMKAILSLSGLMLSVGLWTLSESRLRQVILGTPAYITNCPYVLIPLIVVFGVMYIGAVQKQRYSKYIDTVCILFGIQVLIDMALSIAGIVSYHDSLPLTHVWSAVGILTALITILIDVKTHRVKEYRFIALGMVTLLVFSALEIVMFYISTKYTFGFMLSIGLFVVLGATVFQYVFDYVRNIEKQREDTEKQTSEIIGAIAKTIDAKDKYTGGHSERVGRYAMILADAIKDEYGFSDEDVARIRYIGSLHDIGKIGVPDSVLNKNGRLTDDEFAEMKKHTVYGYDILHNLKFVKGLEDGARYHHERYDGKGYPDGLKGEDIPVIARILCLADSYDAMTTNRVYRKRLDDDIVLSELKKGSGTQFDPHLDEIFIKLINEGRIKHGL